MKPQDLAGPGRGRLEGLVAGATEAEPDKDRHRKEEAILATIAKVGFSDHTLLGFKDLDWSRAHYGAIAKGFWQCFLDNMPVHRDTVTDRMPKDGPAVPDAILAGILDGTKAVDTPVAWNNINALAALDKKRRAMDLGREYLKKVEAGEDVDAMVGGLLQGVCNLAESKHLVTAHPPEIEDACGFLDALDARRVDGRKWQGLDSGFDHLNEVLNGLTEGVFVLAGAPSTGKTTLAKQIADHVAMAEKVPVLFWSYEQSKEELRIKSLARLAHVDSRAIWKGRENKEWDKVKQADENYRSKSGRWLTIIEAQRTDTVEAIRAAALMAKHRAGGKKVLLILDYLQNLPAPESGHADSIKDKVDANLSELRRLARDLKSPVLVISSENRDAYKGNKPPTLSALKESGGIEYSADVVVCLWRNKEETNRMEADRARRNPNDPKTIRVEAHVLKNRNGELAKVKLDFTPAWATFSIFGTKEDLSYADALGE